MKNLNYMDRREAERSLQKLNWARALCVPRTVDVSVHNQDAFLRLDKRNLRWKLDEKDVE